jgi:hypothetical protein
MKKGIVMNKVIAVLVIMLGIVATGCEYEVPLAEKQGLPIDNSVLGIWEGIPPDGEPQTKDRMKVSRYSETEYLVHYFAPEHNRYLRAYPIRIGGLSCIQIQGIHTEKENIKEKDRSYYVFSYELLNGDLAMKCLNPNLVSNNLKSSSELQAAFLRHKDNGNLFIGPSRFRKLSMNATKQEKLGDAFRDAALKGDVATVRNLLAKGEDPNAQDKSGYTPLMLAAGAGHLPVVQALLAKGADVNAKDDLGATALTVASGNGSTAVVEVLRKAMNKPCPANLSDEHVFRLNGRVRTGVVIKRGDRITFRASGRVSFGALAGSGDPEGINGFRGYNLIRGADIQHGALLARIKQQYANDGWYYIGKGRVITSKVDGTLELGVNDIDASNNRGSFTVEVSICRAQ